MPSIEKGGIPTLHQSEASAQTCLFFLSAREKRERRRIPAAARTQKAITSDGEGEGRSQTSLPFFAPVLDFLDCALPTRRAGPSHPLPRDRRERGWAHHSRDGDGEKREEDRRFLLPFVIDFLPKLSVCAFLLRLCLVLLAGWLDSGPNF